MWLVSAEHADHPGNVVAWAVVADRSGGRQEGGELVADTLEDLRAMLPTGLRRGGPSPFWWHNVVEAWDRGGLTQASCWGVSISPRSRLQAYPNWTLREQCFMCRKGGVVSYSETRLSQTPTSSVSNLAEGER